MKVKQLRKYLEAFDDDTEVVMATHSELAPNIGNHIKFWAIDIALVSERLIRDGQYYGIVSRPCRETKDSEKCVVLI